MDRTEQLAQIIVESALPEIKLHFNDEQNQSVADFTIKRAGEIVGVLEATLATDQEAEEMSAAIRDPSRGGVWIERMLSQHDWLIQPEK